MNNFLNNTYKNISWITIIDSQKPWKNIWIIAITHWNETVWLDIFNYLINDFNIQEKLKSWKLYLIANNIKAYQKYIEYWEINSYRFIDDNMNRISNKEFKKWSYEFERFEELKPVFDELDTVIDLHSVPIWNDLIWLTDKKYLQTSKHFFDVETILVDDMKKTWAVIWKFIRQWKEVYWIECGNHIDKSWFKNWLKNVLNFLSFYWCIDFDILKENKKTDIFEFLQEINVKTDKFEFIKDFKWFTKVKNNEIFAVDWDCELKNNIWNSVYLWIPMKKPKKWDWAWFLFRKLD